MSLLDALKESLPPSAANSIELAPIVMIDKSGCPTKKPQDCWKWSRLQPGFGWHDGPPSQYLLKSSCTIAK